ncbi:MAG: hypothetical protein DHS20C09_04260 [marine bacterium B5-7]|nr:MAG: hypothetical protein DHS20C09_04260 [marine bacterium B5-7]
MHLDDKDILNKSIATIYVGKLLDFSIADQVFRICNMAKKPMIKIILIDFTKTYQIMDSGLAMLSILEKHTKHQIQTINFINYKPMIKKILMDKYFNCGNRDYELA